MVTARSALPIALPAFDSLALVTDCFSLSQALRWFSGLHERTDNREMDDALANQGWRSAFEAAERIRVQLADGRLHLLDATRLERDNLRSLWTIVARIIERYRLDRQQPPKRQGRIQLPTVDRADVDELVAGFTWYGRWQNHVQHTKGSFPGDWVMGGDVNWPVFVPESKRPQPDRATSCRYEIVRPNDGETLKSVIRCTECGDEQHTILTDPAEVALVYRRCRALSPENDSPPPHPDGTEPPRFLGDGKYQAGRETLVLEGNEAHVLQGLVELRAATESELVRQSGIDGAARVLKHVREKFPALAPHITLPGGRGKGGYRTAIIDVRKRPAG